ncbi:hypothetical protein B0H19DRAFT_1270555 [Mycena capillaripes]|nr:hypothetical protein B0H19DRAFT_1270555 [Mycena capillaripes]
MPRLPLFNSSASNEWISPLITVSRGLVSVGNCAPFPYVSTALSAGLALLELIQTVGQTTNELKYLAESVVTIMKLLGEEMEAHPTASDAKFLKVCIEFNMHLTRISKDIESMSKDWSSSKFKKYIKANCIRDEIAQFTRRVSDLRADATLIAATGTRMDLAEVANAVSSVKSGVSQIQTELAAIRSPATTDASQDLVHFEENFHALKVGDIHLDFQTARTSDYELLDFRTRATAQIGWTDYKGYVRGSPQTIRVYRGSDASEVRDVFIHSMQGVTIVQPWKEFLFYLAEHSPSPGLPQLFGFCSSLRLYALVFHGESKTLDEYGASLSSSHEIVAWEKKLRVDLNDLENFHYERGLHNLSSVRQFALVDAQSGKLMITHVETSPRMNLTSPYEGPFLEWFTTSYSVLLLYQNRHLRLQINGGHCNSLHEKLFELTKLRRIIGQLLCSLFGGNMFAQLRDCEPSVGTAWRVVRMSFGVIDAPLRYPAEKETDSGWTHFVVPLMKKTDQWNSFYDYRPHCGYALSADLEFGANIPAMSVAWMAQSGIFVTSDSYPPAFRIPFRTDLALTWEMVLCEENVDSLALLETLPDLHVFVQVPVPNRGRISEPRLYWSTNPTQKETSLIPPGMFKVRFKWNPQIEFEGWEKHHYDVARGLLEEYGFDPSTTAAATALGLPLLEACDPNSTSVPNHEDEWCDGNVVEIDPHMIGLEV